MAAREKSPTLRMFASGDKEPGAKKRSVLDRLEDSKFSQSSPPKVFSYNVFPILKSLFAFRRVKVKRSSRKKKWQILCEGCSCAIHPPCHSVYPSFLAGTQLARKWQRGWQPSSQRKMRYFTQESDNCMIFLSSEVHPVLLIKLVRSLRCVAKA